MKRLIYTTVAIRKGSIVNITKAKLYVNYLQAIESVLVITLSDEEIDELVENFSECKEDFDIKIGAKTYRFIHESVIEELYGWAIQYLVFEKFHNSSCEDPRIAIDWKQTALNYHMGGYGYGRAFLSFDGLEERAGDYYIFRIK